MEIRLAQKHSSFRNVCMLLEMHAAWVAQTLQLKNSNGSRWSYFALSAFNKSCTKEWCSISPSLLGSGPATWRSYIIFLPAWRCCLFMYRSCAVHSVFVCHFLMHSCFVGSSRSYFYFASDQAYHLCPATVGRVGSLHTQQGV